MNMQEDAARLGNPLSAFWTGAGWVKAAKALETYYDVLDMMLTSWCAPLSSQPYASI